jgi:hypothetical protein
MSYTIDICAWQRTELSPAAQTARVLEWLTDIHGGVKYAHVFRYPESEGHSELTTVEPFDAVALGRLASHMSSDREAYRVATSAYVFGVDRLTESPITVYVQGRQFRKSHGKMPEMEPSVRISIEDVSTRHIEPFVRETTNESMRSVFDSNTARLVTFIDGMLRFLDVTRLGVFCDCNLYLSLNACSVLYRSASDLIDDCGWMADVIEWGLLPYTIPSAKTWTDEEIGRFLHRYLGDELRRLARELPHLVDAFRGTDPPRVEAFFRAHKPLCFDDWLYLGNSCDPLGAFAIHAFMELTSSSTLDGQPSVNP